MTSDSCSAGQSMWSNTQMVLEYFNNLLLAEMTVARSRSIDFFLYDAIADEVNI